MIIIKMSEIHVYLRRSNGICIKVNASPNQPIFELYEMAANTLKLEPNAFLIVCAGKTLERSPQQQASSLEEWKIKSNTILDVIELENEKAEEITVLVQYQETVNPLAVNCLETFESIRERIAEIVALPISAFHICYQNRGIENEQFATPEDYKMADNDILQITKVLEERNQTGFSGRIRMVESIASSSDRNQQKIPAPKTGISSVQKNLLLKKKNSYSFSMKKIEEKKDENVKKSAIEPFSIGQAYKNAMGLKQIIDAKETMSFGSLESAKQDDLSIVLTNIQKTKYYKFSCLAGCTGAEIRLKLAKLERVKPAQVIIDEIEDEEQIEQVIDLGAQGTPNLVYKILRTSE